MYDFICENGRVEDSGLEALLNSKAQSGMISYRQYTTRIFCDEFSGTVDDAVHLLEIRLFNENAEIRASRPEIGMPFTWRIIDDSRFREELSGDETFEDRTYTEQQYLDIDSQNQRAGIILQQAAGITRYRWRTLKSWRYGTTAFMTITAY